PLLFADPCPTRSYPLSLHDALPISDGGDGLAFHDNADFPLQEQVDPVGHKQERNALAVLGEDGRALRDVLRLARELEEIQRDGRSEEHTSELQSLRHLVCRLLLEKK